MDILEVVRSKLLNADGLALKKAGGIVEKQGVVFTLVEHRYF